MVLHLHSRIPPRAFKLIPIARAFSRPVIQTTFLGFEDGSNSVLNHLDSLTWPIKIIHETGHLCWYIAAATAGGGRLDMTQVSSIPMCATGLEG